MVVDTLKLFVPDVTGGIPIFLNSDRETGNTPGTSNFNVTTTIVVMVVS